VETEVVDAVGTMGGGVGTEVAAVPGGGDFGCKALIKVGPKVCHKPIKEGACCCPLGPDEGG
jgi:hypothetical protein